MWAYVSGGFRWVFTDAGIHVLTKINTHFLQLFQLPKEMAQSTRPRISMYTLAWLVLLKDRCRPTKVYWYVDLKVD